MASSYPNALKSFSTKLPGQTVASAHIDDLQDEVVAIEGALLNGFIHDLKPTIAGAHDLGSAALPWGLARVGAVQLIDAAELTLATGAVTVTQGYHRLDTEGDAASDDLDTITPGTGLGAGFILVVRAENIARIVTLKNGTGNLKLQSDCALSATERTLSLIYDGTNWREIARSVSPSSAMTLLKAGNGTSTAVGATTVDSVVLPTLTANDTIIVEYYAESVSNTTATPVFYHVTDAANILAITGGSWTTGLQYAGRFMLKQRQGASTNYVAQAHNAVVSSGGNNILENSGIYAATAAWTAAWTLGLRHGGVTAGGTFKWQWSVYVLAGQ